METTAGHKPVITIGDEVAVAYCVECTWQYVERMEFRPTWTPEDWRGSIITAHSLVAQERYSKMTEI